MCVRGSFAVSSSVTADFTPPTAGSVADAVCAPGVNYTRCTENNQPDVSFTLDTDVASARWAGFDEPESDIAYYEACARGSHSAGLATASGPEPPLTPRERVCAAQVCAGSTPLSCDLVPSSTVSANSSYVQLQLPYTLTHGMSACVSVAAVSDVGARSEVRVHGSSGPRHYLPRRCCC